jgi:hypothetical protein
MLLCKHKLNVSFTYVLKQTKLNLEVGKKFDGCLDI